MPTPVIIAGFEFYPEPFNPRPFKIGGPTRRSLSGKGYQKCPGEKQRFTLTWSAATVDEYQMLKIIWTQSKSDTLAITCADPAINGNFHIQDQELNFELLEGNEGPFYRGSLTFEEE